MNTKRTASGWFVAGSLAAALLVLGASSQPPVHVGSITVIPKGSPPGAELPSPVRIASGAIESDAHQADVAIRTDPPAANALVKVWLEKGVGYELGKDAKLTIGGKVVTGEGKPALIHTDAEGKIAGVLTSSDVFSPPEPGCIIHANDKRVEVLFDHNAWADEADPYDEIVPDKTYTPGEPFTDQDGDGVWTPPEWIMQPRRFRVPGTITNTFRFRHFRYAIASNAVERIVKERKNWKPLDGHAIRLFVSVVQYQSTNGEIVTLLNTPRSPRNLCDWAETPVTPVITDSNGIARIVVQVKDRPELQALSLTWRDCSVHDNPRSNATQAIQTSEKAYP